MIIGQQLITDWVSNSDHTHECDNIGVSELPHNGCFLKEWDSVAFCCSWFKRLHSYVHTWLSCFCPYSFTHFTKLTRTKLLCYSIKSQNVCCLTSKFETLLLTWCCGRKFRDICLHRADDITVPDLKQVSRMIHFRQSMIHLISRLKTGAADMLCKQEGINLQD